MARIIKQPLSILLTRQIHTAVQQNGLNKTMNKVMGSAAKKKSKYYELPTMPLPSSFSKGANEGKHSSESKRVTVLNKVFMRYVTELMATGENCSLYLGHNIQVNYVKTSPDFKFVNIYWSTSEKANEVKIEEILKESAYALRHELAQLKVIGMVPALNFVKDKKASMLFELDRQLALADYGDDHQPTQPYNKLKTELQLNLSLEPQIIEKIKELENEDAEDTVIDEDPLPIMPQNVFNLDHAYIMDKVKKSLHKSTAPHRLQGSNETISEPSTNFEKTINKNPLEYKSSAELRKAFRQFLETRKREVYEARKEYKNYRPEMSYLEDEYEQRRSQELAKYDLDDYKDDYDEIEEEGEKF